jgi:hypothetical protein
LPRTNTLAYYKIRKLRPKKFYSIDTWGLVVGAVAGDLEELQVGQVFGNLLLVPGLEQVLLVDDVDRVIILVSAALNFPTPSQMHRN